MGTAARHKQKRVEPQLVLCSEANKPVDDAVKALIEEWFVPALVEEYIRLNQLRTEQCNHPNSNAASPKTEHALMASSTTAETEKLQSDCGVDSGIRR